VEDWEKLRERMVEEQLRRRGIRDERVLEAMRTVPRHEFIPSGAPLSAYGDEPRPIGAGQTISQPYMVAAMAMACELGPQDKVLEIGGGSGYAAAVMACLAAHVYTVEIVPALAQLARDNLTKTGFADRVTVIEGDGSEGYPPEAPYQAISVAAASPSIPPALFEQLDENGGRLVIPVGGADEQQLRLVRRLGDRTQSRIVVPCRFVPLRGALGRDARREPG